MEEYTQIYEDIINWDRCLSAVVHPACPGGPEPGCFLGGLTSRRELTGQIESIIIDSS